MQAVDSNYCHASYSRPQQRLRAASLPTVSGYEDGGRMRTAPSRSARFVRMQPAHTIAPISIDLKIGRVCCCRWCNGHLPLCQGAAAQGHQAMRLAAASLMPPFVAHASTNSGRIVDASEQCVHFCECMCDLQCTRWCCRACNPSHNMSLRVQVTRPSTFTTACFGSRLV